MFVQNYVGMHPYFVIWGFLNPVLTFSGFSVRVLHGFLPLLGGSRMHIIGSMAGFWVRRMLNPATEVQAQGMSWAALRDKVTAQPVPNSQ